MMKINWRKLLIISSILFISYSGYLYLLPTRIIGVYKGRWVVVHNLPYLKHNRVKWWKNNEDLLKSQYNIPSKDWGDIYSVTVIDIGDGFKKKRPKNDSIFPERDISYLICFDEIHNDASCLDKNNRNLEISKNKKEGFIFREN